MIQIEHQPFAPPVRTLKEIERDDIVRQTLDEAERRVVQQAGNSLYRQAWKVVVKILRGMKP